MASSAFTPLSSQPWSRLSEIDTPASPTPSSPVLSVTQSWTSGEIPIFLSLSPSTLPVADTISSLFPFTGSVDTFGYPVQRSAGLVSRLSSESDSSGSNSTIEHAEDDYHNADQSVLSFSEYLTSAYRGSDYIADGDRGSERLVTQPNERNVESPATPSFLPRKRERCKSLSHSDRLLTHLHNGHNLCEHDADVPSSLTHNFLLSPVASTISGPSSDSLAYVHQQRHLRATSVPDIPSHSTIIGSTPPLYNQSPQPLMLCSPVRERSNSNPYLPLPAPRNFSTPASIPSWLRGKRIVLWIDQEGFRAIRPRLELVSFSQGTGLNAAGETLDVAEFVMRKRQTWHFHYAPLESAPVLRRLTVNADMNDFISRQAALTLRANGVWAVESAEDKGRIAWKFEYRVEDRRVQESGKIMAGEKRFTPLRFVCNPTLLCAEHGKRVKLLQFVRKSITPKLQSVRLHGNSAAVEIRPRATVPDRRVLKELVMGSKENLFSNRPNRANVAAGQQHHTQAFPHSDRDHHPRLITNQHIVPPSVLNAMFPLYGSEGVDGEGPPLPHGVGK